MRSVLVAYRPDAVPALEETVLSLLREEVRVVLDLDGLAVLDTAGVRGLVSLLRSARAVGGELALRSTKPGIRRTLEVTALDRIFSLDGSEAA
ncbi:MAG: anti-sigma factor antagonist [Candidatus Eremiobacteraeota bacterium]|nr:anti-sigma factor antagonist [Candidatus Eremiobacteraeota bacterium]